MTSLAIRRLTASAFSPFGQVISTETAQHFPINSGMTERYHDLACIEVAGDNPRPLISIFRGKPYQLPLELRLVERHPLGSQAFFPLSAHPWLVIVAPDENGLPGEPLVFAPAPNVGVNIAMNIWHGVLTPLEAVGDFLVIDRGGDGTNLEEHVFAEPYVISDAE